MIEQVSGKVLATHFGAGKTHDFALFLSSGVTWSKQTCCLADAGYQGLSRRLNAKTPVKRSKHHPLSVEQRLANQLISRQRIVIEQVIGRLKRFKIIAERYRNRRRRFGLRFNLIAALYNFELKTDL